jgi:uncharacterized protein YndB with AHSA1/START domain
MRRKGAHMRPNARQVKETPAQQLDVKPIGLIFCAQISRERTTVTLETPPIVDTGMLIRRPPEAVFEAVADPAITSRFWFSKGSGRLEPGAKVRWDWEMYGVHADVRVREVEPNRRILMDWGDEESGYTEVAWTFEPRGEHTFLRVVNSGFAGADEAQISAALDSMGGFSLVTAALKAWLEHGIVLEVVGDRHPDARAPGWTGRR